MKKRLLAVALSATTAVTALAGGLLTNTNQSIAFLRNPARDGAIGIDGIYSNPAGVMFLDKGFHLSVNWQAAFQTRTIESTNALLYSQNLNDQATTKKFEGKATAPFIPSVHAAYNTNNWSFQFGFSVHGGGGKCNFDEGIGTFDEALGGIATAIGANGYRATSDMEGAQYYFGFTLGAAYKINEHLSVYGGLRALYGNATYKAHIQDIKVNAMVAENVYQEIPFGQLLERGIVQATEGIQLLEGGIQQLHGVIQQMETAGLDASQYKEQLENYQGQLMSAQNKLGMLESLAQYSKGVNLQSDQSGFGIAPIIGIDYKTEHFNLAAKYEFRTAMRLKNKSTLDKAGILEPLKKFEDGTSIREDNPAMLSIGAQWSPNSNLRVNAGFHYFFDKDSKKYGDEQKKLDGGTKEFLGGIEWDPAEKWTVSAGFQITNYGLTDEFMNDMSFVVNSWSFGLGAKYQVTPKVAIQAAYFQTNYDNYKAAANDKGSVNEYTRTNKVVGLGVDFKF